ncbi:MAG: UDP-3-O-(3-hydroxymyristoyl)glucosamine N-acyltransferase [Steroidobacteraceae bacterium]
MTAVPGQTSVGMTLGELAIRFGCSLQGDPDVRVSHVGTLEAADNTAVAFIANPSYRKFLATTGAGVVVLDPSLAGECPTAALLTKNPHAVYARIAALLHPVPVQAGGVHRTASVDESAVVHADAAIGPMTVIEAGAHIGPRVVIGPGCVIMRGARIGADSRLVAGVTLCHGVQIGERVLMHPGVVVGADGFGLAMDRGQWLKVPQVGSVEIGDDVEIGANTTIDRGAIENTVIGPGVKLDNQIQIGHNVRIGANTAIAACSGISGSTTIGQRCMLGGQTGVAGHLTICDDVVVTGKSLITGNINKPGVYSGGLPVDEAARFRKNAARFNQLDELARQVRKLRRDPGGNTEPQS